MTTSRKFTMALSYLRSVLDDVSFSGKEKCATELDSIVNDLESFRLCYSSFLGSVNYYPR